MLKREIYYSQNKEKKFMVIYYTLLLSFCMLFDLNNVLDYILTGGFILLFALFYQRKFFLFTYVALIFFESKLAIPEVGGSILRILPICYLMRFVFSTSCFKNLDIKKSIFTLSFMWVFIFAQAQVTTRIFELLTMGAKLICIAEIAVEAYGANYLDKENYKNLFFFTVALFAMFSGIYGLYNGLVMDSEGMLRYCGTIDDPNMSAMLYCLGIVSLFSVRGLPKAVKATMFFVLLLNVVLTVSIGGFISLIILLFIYLIIRNWKLGLLGIAIFTIGMVIFCYLPLPEGNVVSSMQSRIIQKIGQFFAGDFDAVTTGRYALSIKYRDYFNSLPIMTVLFGGLDTISGPFRDYMFELMGNVSHNSYIDMMYMHGYFGEILIVGFIVLRVIFLLVKYFKNKDKKQTYDLSFALQKITLLLFSTNLSLYPFRYYIFFMLI